MFVNISIKVIGDPNTENKLVRDLADLGCQTDLIINPIRRALNEYYRAQIVLPMLDVRVAEIGK